MRVIVVGSRSFNDAGLLGRKLSKLLNKLDKKSLTILSGHAKGADRLAEKWALDNGIRIEVFHPDDWKQSKAAGYIRDLEMLDADPDYLVAFWDGRSSGTADIITKAKKRGIKTRIVKI